MTLKLKEKIYSNTYGTHICMRLLPDNKRIEEIDVYITENGLTERTSADNNPDFPKSEIRRRSSKRFMSYIDPQGRRPLAPGD